MSITPKRVPLDAWHRAHGAKMCDFAGYDMPLYYGKPLAEHHAVRERGGIFDVSHMGLLDFEGAQAQGLLQQALSCDVAGLAVGRARYGLLCNESGGVIDDVICYRLAPSRWWLIVNAGNQALDRRWLGELAARRRVAPPQDLSSGYGIVALQGPQVLPLLADVCDVDPRQMPYFSLVQTAVGGHACLLARTGYSGEPGVELVVQNEVLPSLWAFCVETLALSPIGLAARDSLRTEAGLPLHGHELRPEWHPFESGVGWAVHLEGDDDFCGKTAIRERLAAEAEKAAGSKLGASPASASQPMRQVGLELLERGIAREGSHVFSVEGSASPADGTKADALPPEGKDAPLGEVTSGLMSPTLGKAIALGRLPRNASAQGQRVTVQVRHRRLAAEVVPLPFYRHPQIRKRWK